MTTLTDDDILRHFEMPGLNLEATLDTHDLGLLLTGIRELLSASKPAVAQEQIAMRDFDAPYAPIKWPHEITAGHIKCLIEDHQRDGKKQLDHGLTSSGSYLIRVAESFRWCLEQIDAASPAEPAQLGPVADIPEGCTVADAKMLREANHGLAAENDRLKQALGPFARLVSTDKLSWAMVEYCIEGDPEKQTLQRPQMQRAFNRAAEAYRNAAPQPFQTAVELDDERAAFEAWGNETFNYGFQPETWDAGEELPIAREACYQHEGTQMAWEGWQARAAFPQATAMHTFTGEQIAALRVAADALIERYAAPIRSILANAEHATETQPASGATE